jgi:hypothetical protein
MIVSYPGDQESGQGFANPVGSFVEFTAGIDQSFCRSRVAQGRLWNGSEFESVLS